MTGDIMSAARAALAEDRLEDAEALLRQAIGPAGAHESVLMMLARVLRGQGKITQARELQSRLVELRPGNLVYRFDLAETLLLLGEFERGWREYKYRYSLPYTLERARKMQRPRWDGKPLKGRAILIHDEQGYGDTLQFLRLVRFAAARGGRVILEVHPALLEFARRFGAQDALIARGELPPAFDVHCELMSLPDVLGLRLEDLPGPMPYLTPEPAHVAKWRQRLAGLKRPVVALVWAGTPTHVNDHNRSMRLAQFAPLGGTGASFITVQKGKAAAQAETPPFPLVNLDPEIMSFEDTAAILSLADLLVSVDSAPAHLAGALGRPVWTLLPFVPDWRWLLTREDTPWYPSMRLIRQRQRGDWAEVMGRVAGGIVEICKEGYE
jgi:hypothetical protein